MSGERLNKQKIIYVLSVLLLIAGFLMTLVLSEQKYAELTTPYFVSSGEIVDKSGNVLTRFGPQVEATARTNAVIHEHDNNYYLTSGSAALFQEYQKSTYFYSGSGISYLQITSPIKFNLNNQLIDIDDVSFLYDATNKQLYLVSGTIKLPNGEVNSNQIISYNEGSFKSSAVVRSQLKKYTALFDFLNQQRQLPNLFSDLEPPQIQIIAPTDINVKTKQLNIVGKTEPKAKVTINSDSVQVDDNGQFNHMVTLQVGTNKFIITAVDEWNNETRQELTVVRKSEIIRPVITNSDDCSLGEIESQLFCLINSDLVNNSVPKLIFNDKLGEIAETQSVNLSDGIKPTQTMTQAAHNAGANFTKSKEISIQLSVGFTAQTALEKVLVDNNNELLTGGYKEIGIGIYDNQLNIILIN